MVFRACAAAAEKNGGNANKAFTMAPATPKSGFSDGAATRVGPTALATKLPGLCFRRRAQPLELAEGLANRIPAVMLKCDDAGTVRADMLLTTKCL